jgi:predicted acylesterase/phospholipase RssA
MASNYQPKSDRKGIALCLSGGGFRASLFHLGSLRRLNEVGLLSQINTVTSVSGGSITNALLAKHWPRFTGGKIFANFANFENDLRQFCARDIRIDDISPGQCIEFRRLGDTKSAQTPSSSRSHEVRFGARRWARFMMSNWCLTVSDSAATAPRPPGLASFARVTSRWAIKMNISRMKRTLTLSERFTRLRY